MRYVPIRRIDIDNVPVARGGDRRFMTTILIELFGALFRTWPYELLHLTKQSNRVSSLQYGNNFGQRHLRRFINDEHAKIIIGIFQHPPGAQTSGNLGTT